MHKHDVIHEELKVVSSLSRLQKVILDTLDLQTVVQDVVNATLKELEFLGFDISVVVLNLIDEKADVLRRTSISHTDVAKAAVQGLPIPFSKVEIPMEATENICVSSIHEKKSMLTHSWDDILSPPLKPEDAIMLQKGVGVRTSIVFPLISRDSEVGSMIFSFQKNITKLSSIEEEVLWRMTDTAGLAVQNSRLYTNLHQANQKITRANKRLREIDTLKDEFISLASHELRTPMTAIKGYLWMTLNQAPVKLHPTVEHNLEICYQSAERLIRLVNDMLTVSRIEGKRIKINKVSMELADLTRQICEEMAIPAQQKGLRLQCPVAKGDTRLVADPDKLRQVITNIIGNAIKFTPPKGKVTMKMQTDATQVHVIISDTGPGIRPEDRDKLFTKFGKFEHAYEQQQNITGTGLGLYISKQIVSLHDGSITVESEVGKGTTFTVSLPKPGTKSKGKAAESDTKRNHSRNKDHNLLARESQQKKKGGAK